MLSDLTIKLLQMNKTAVARKETVMQKEEHSPDFYGEVKPFCDEGSKLLTEWRPFVLQWLAAEKPLYIHPSQIESTIENLETVMVQSFYKEAKSRRFFEQAKSVEYVLESILSQLDALKE